MTGYSLGRGGDRRDSNKRVSEKRGDTSVRRLGCEFSPGLAPDFRSDARLEAVRRRAGTSLLDLVPQSAGHRQ